MATVISLLPRLRFEAAGVGLTADWEFNFLASRREDDIIAACRNADFLLVPSANTPIDAGIISNISSISLIQMTGSGCDQVDLKAARAENLPVANVPGENAVAVAEFTLGLIIALQRQLVVADREIKAGNYGEVRERLLARGLPEIRDTELGLIGFGAIGQQVARLANVLGARVSYFSSHRRPAEMEKEMAVAYKPLDQLLASSQVISLHIPLNDQTRGFIGRKELALMPPAALLINTARGEVVESAALAAALEAGLLGGAAVDTFTPEPPPPDHPLLCLSRAARDRLIMTPHLAGVTAGSFKRMLTTALENLARVARGDEPRHVVNGVERVRNFPPNDRTGIRQNR